MKRRSSKRAGDEQSVFFDTNVLLDHLFDRAPFADDATELWSMAERHGIVGLVSAISFNFVYCIVRHEADERAGRRAVKGIRDVFETIEVDAQILNQAIDLNLADFEDGIEHACAIRGQATHLLTRDSAGFRRSAMAVVSPEAYLRAQGAEGDR